MQQQKAIKVAKSRVGSASDDVTTLPHMFALNVTTTFLMKLRHVHAARTCMRGHFEPPNLFIQPCTCYDQNISKTLQNSR